MGRGAVEGAIHLPLNEIMAGAGSDLDASKPVVVICGVATVASSQP